MKPTVILLFTLFSLSSAVVLPQDFSSIDTDLLALETLLQDTINNTRQIMHAQRVDE